jgi:hypothetical protein
MLIVMVFLAFPPPPLGFLLSIQPVLPGLHHISTHTCCHLDHFHFMGTSCMKLLLMNIGPLYSFPIDIMLDIINGSCSCDLSVR